MWKCPKCKREFINRNQDHSCGDFSVEKIFKKYPDVLPLFETLRNEVLKFGDIKISPVKNAVLFSVNSTFLALKPHSKYLTLEFASDIIHNEFPIEKTIQISKKRFAHFLKIDSFENIDQQLLIWLKEAYYSDL